MRARVASFLTIIGLVLATGGALALATGSAHSSRGAATAQYKPGKHCGNGKPKKGCHHHHHNNGNGNGVSGTGNQGGGGNGSGNGSSGVSGTSQGSSGSGASGTTEEVGLSSTNATGQSSGSLPFTGQDLLIVVLVGLVLAGVGLGISLRVRRTS